MDALCMTDFRGTHLSGFYQSCEDAESRYQSNTESIVVIIIQRPQDYAGNLENIERVYDL